MVSAAVLPSRRNLPTALAVVVLTISVLLFVPSHAAAASPNYISGNACTGGNTKPTWNTGDTQILYGNVTVPFGCTLTIEPGAFVKADQGVHLYVHGQLLANGTSTSRISFDVNKTREVWGGIQFNRTSTGSYIEYSTIHMTVTGVKAVRTSPFLEFDLIDHAFTGVDYQDSSGWVGWTTINYTANPVRANGSLGSPVIVANTITTVLGDPSVAVYVTNVNTVTIQSNTIRGMFGANRTTPAIPGARGPDGGFVVGIFVNGSGSGLMAGNTLDRLVGGRGGDGAAGVGNGGAGGNGGSVTALVMANTPNTRMQNNAVTNLYGGHGGNGGASGTALSAGGAGGTGGDVLAMEILNATASGWWFYNTISGLIGGSAGNGGSGPGLIGGGGTGGNAYGLFAITASNTNASNLGIQNLRGGYGGNSSNGAQGTTGGAGGQAGGLWILNVGGTAILGNNSIQTMTGGQGGSGRSAAGEGGGATAVLLAGDRSSDSASTPYNLTTVANNQVSGITGGVGGLGSVAGPNGGNAVGVAAANVTLVSLKNTVQSLAGGMGGSAASGQPAGSGGDALAFLVGLVPKGISSRDGVLAVSGGARGTTGTAPPASHGVGLYVAGNRTLTSRLSFTNGTIGSVSDFDLSLNDYTETTALNSTFSTSRSTVAAAANLTVRNFLAVKAFWPNNVTLVTRVVVTVTDGLVTTFSRVIPSGFVQWIPVTNRVYIDGLAPSWNTTQAAVSFGSYAFTKEPRTVNMTASQTQYFTMIDGSAPSSSASPLPPWMGTRSFTVHYTYSDGNGTGVSNISLWSNRNSTGWVQSGLAIPSGTGTGSFLFNAPTDGTYQFATTAYDRAGNHQPFPPSANDTWTMVDTAIPVSTVSVLPTFETSLSFPVSWGPVGSETDIAFYVIQYLHGATWTTWLGDTTLRSQLFNITALGLASP